MENTQAGVIGGDSPWWQSPVPSRGSDKCAIAYYRHSAQGKQKNSIELQAEQVKTDAAARGLVIVDEFIDRGYSGLTANRPGFQALLNAVRTRKDFRYVMVLDVSRWGRFIDSNEFGRYEAEFVHQANTKMNRIMAILMQLDELGQHEEFVRLAESQNLSALPALSGPYQRIS